MPPSKDLLITTSLQNSLDRVDKVKDKFPTADLEAHEKWALMKWFWSARVCVVMYVLLLDSTETRRLEHIMIACFEDDPNLERKEESLKEIKKKRVLPQLAHQRITAYFEEVTSKSGSAEGNRYKHPSDLVGFFQFYPVSFAIYC